MAAMVLGLGWKVEAPREIPDIVRGFKEIISGSFQNRGTPKKTPEYSYPYYRDPPKKGTS